MPHSLEFSGETEWDLERGSFRMARFPIFAGGVALIDEALKGFPLRIVVRFFAEIAPIIVFSGGECVISARTACFASGSGSGEMRMEWLH